MREDWGDKEGEKSYRVLGREGRDLLGERNNGGEGYKDCEVLGR